MSNFSGGILVGLMAAGGAFLLVGWGIAKGEKIAVRDACVSIKQDWLAKHRDWADDLGLAVGQDQPR